MKRIFERISHLGNIIIIFIVLMLLSKGVELAVLFPEQSFPFSVWMTALFHHLLFVSVQIVALGALFFALSFIGRRTATVFTAVLMALFFLSEWGLAIYLQHNGTAIGSELVTRPLAEQFLAVQGAVGVVLPLVLIVVVLVLFVCGALWFSRRCWRGAWLSFPFSVVFALAWAFLPSAIFVDGRHDAYMLNHTSFALRDIFAGSSSALADNSSTHIPFDADKLARLLATHPEWNPSDVRYPLERVDSLADFLSPFFRPSDTLPHLVLLVVESLGDEFIGCGLMPYLDSLAATGLYWNHCLSTTMRSYGAVPAVTASVGGPRSFQFGLMPDHNSLLSILRHGGYRTMAFYGGNFGFDCIYDYLIAQQIDYLSPFFEESRSKENADKSNWWGYFDQYTLNRTSQVLAQQSSSSPTCDLVVTLTMHEDLNLPDKQRQEQLLQRTRNIQSLHQLSFPEARAAACLYTDDCIRHFVDSCRAIPGFQNTIFVITGDHASGLRKEHKLHLHHVPLIIHSSLLRQPSVFSHLVTHNDIAPALVRLLAHNYGLQLPPTVHWLGDGLQPSPKTMLIVNYAHRIEELLWGQYFYQTGNEWEPEAVYRVADDLSMSPVHEDHILQSCREQMALMRYLFSYTYYSNRLTAHPLYPRSNYHLVKQLSIPSARLFVTPSTPPSQGGGKHYPLLKHTRLRHLDGSTRLRLTVSADVLINDSLWQDQYMELAFQVQSGENYFESDHISKFIVDDVLHKDSTYHLSVTKEFRLNPNVRSSAGIAIKTARYDDVWVPNSKLTFSNTIITIEYGQ